MNQSEKSEFNRFYHKMLEVLSQDQILCDEPMCRHTTFRVGGPADYLVLPRLEQVADIFELCRQEQVSCQIIGNGSNLLVGDLGIRGVVLAFGKPAAQLQLDGERLTAGAGALLSQAAGAAQRAGLGGIEFAAGIPGSVGGAVVMNAGAYGGEMKDILSRVKVLAHDGSLRVMDCKDLELSYRHSGIPERKMTVLEAEFILQQKPKEEILALMEDLKQRRLEKQPLEYASAGSTFKRPKGYFAGKLIMDAGLAGYTIGGAQVSAKHCGFIINTGHASAADIMELIQYVQHKVHEQFQVTLEMEVKCIGEFA